MGEKADNLSLVVDSATPAVRERDSQYGHIGLGGSAFDSRAVFRLLDPGAHFAAQPDASPASTCIIFGRMQQESSELVRFFLALQRLGLGGQPEPQSRTDVLLVGDDRMTEIRVSGPEASELSPPRGTGESRRRSSFTNDLG
jgi:hypothetical protein